jgi:hypothetical protein
MHVNRLHLDEDRPLCLRQETDTAHPLIPIYYIHDGDTPFCSNAHCFCQRGKWAGALLCRQIAEGKLQPVQLVHATTPAPVRSIPTIPEDCQMYGHSWHVTEHPDVKECTLCHERGYCPGCTPVAPAGAQPFLCTYHTQQRQV